MFSNSFFPEKACYFVGIGGVSMSALALLLSERGIRVRGCDARESHFTRKLRAAGLRVTIGEEEISENTIVYTEAVDMHAANLERARRAGKRLLSRAELLGRIAEEYPHVLAVAGCHGKTSATAMLAHIFSCGKRAFTCHIGGEDLDLGNYHCTGGDYLLTEACEFRRSFLRLKSEIAVVLNTDLDHTDCYRDHDDLLAAYRMFAESADMAVVNADDAGARSIPCALSFGLYAGDVRAKHLFGEGERYAFTVTEKGTLTVRIRLRVHGKVQIYNALAAYAAARLAGFTPEEIRRGLESFRGVKRRFEKVGTLNGAPVICDYAHHPREIAAAMDAAEGICAGTVRVVFQPHTYTRTRDLMKDFVAVLRRAENPIIYRTYAARERFSFDGSAVALVSRVPEASYVQSPENLKKRLLEEVGKADVVLALGAGDIYEIVKGIVDG